MRRMEDTKISQTTARKPLCFFSIFCFNVVLSLELMMWLAGLLHFLFTSFEQRKMRWPAEDTRAYTEQCWGKQRQMVLYAMWSIAASRVYQIMTFIDAIKPNDEGDLLSINWYASQSMVRIDKPLLPSICLRIFFYCWPRKTWNRPSLGSICENGAHRIPQY